ncbi:vitamin B12 ABC transporter permease BtuC [Halanaeroarchaeum sulfurireducens]|uniref:Fe3+-siderophore ABC transporter permease n=1 Tax=Halanaeroarchaeum sulfurireducens TaxID=1604004 RepID=A0A0F7PAZ5_9EURY|nr:vitamin B12 ABC transporter permease BtuC [Halanaeroarchaeum sulfurireducens]AKH96814.1 Fe3+-siderophore ABC transporter permease [Halanaeroarchaeum sulfurireducens]ALG81216.1 Fe3+-siderophore ABC transporter permease [Halanaeroarchaeum sulfurireducens]
MRDAIRGLGWIGGLLVVLVLTIVGSAAVGPVSIPPLSIAKIILGAVAVPSAVNVGWATGEAGLAVPTVGIEYARLTTVAVPETSETIVLGIRLPRIVLGALVGFSLAGAGAVMQGFFRNPMADPSIIGVSSGAAVGAVAAITLPIGLDIHAAAFLTGLATAFAVYLIATEGGRTPVATLLLAGVAVQTFLGAVISYMLVYSGESLQQAVFWLMGHLHTASWAEVRLTLLTVPPLFAALLWYARDLNVLLLGEEDARTLGVEVERTKRMLLGLSSLLTAAAVAVSGVIGFVGLIVPHIMRLLVGPDHRLLLPTSALAGASFLVATDTIARAGAAELPVGIVTAALGAPFFLYLLRRREVHAL